MTDKYLTPTAVSVDRDGDNDIRLTLWVDPMSVETIRVKLPLADAVDLLRNFSNQVTYAVEDAVRSLQMGDCPQCKNARVVDDPDSKQGFNMHCPDCRPNPLPPFARPRIGGGVR